MIIQDLHSIVRQAEEEYVSGSVTISEYVEFDMHDTVEKIDAYLNSTHTSGPTDSLGRDKPFFNIVTAASNIWYRATDLDRKNFKFLPDTQDTIGHAFIANILLQQWMRDARFGTFLNEWGRTLARYGSAVCKFVETDGELKAMVVPWNRLIVDSIDFEALPVIETVYRTPAQLRSNPLYDQDVVDELISALESRETVGGEDKDDVSKFIKLYEVHGELPEHLLTDDEPDEEKDIKYRQQMHVIAHVKGKSAGGTETVEDFTLYRGREAKNPYMLTHLIKEDGRTLSIGAVEHLFEAQWMVNHSQKNIKDTLDLASKLIFQTVDTRYTGRNVLSAIETGDIMVHEANAPLTRIANDKADIQAFQNFQMTWQNIASEITSTPDAIKGQNLPSGTPYSLGAYLGGQANSLFEIMTENKGLHLEDMAREFIIPHLEKKMDNKDEVLAVLDAENITELDAMYIPKEAKRQYNKEAKRQLLEGEIPSPYQPEVFEGQVQQQLTQLGDKRSFRPDELDSKTWKQSLKDLSKRLVVEVTNEQSDKQTVLTTLSTALQTIASNPAILQDPNAKMLFNAILTETGKISPLQLQTTSASPPSSTGGTEALTALTQTNNGTEQPTGNA